MNTTVKYHNGRAYFATMKWYTPGYRMRINTSYLTSTTTMHFVNGFWR